MSVYHKMPWPAIKRHWQAFCDIESQDAAVLNMKIEDLELSARSKNVFRNEDIDNVGELLLKDFCELTRCPNFGQVSFTEIVWAMHEIGVKSKLSWPGQEKFYCVEPWY